MTGRLSTAAGCIALSLLSVWIVDPASRNAAFLTEGVLWGAAGVLVVWLVTLVARRRTRAGGRDLAQ